MSKTLARARRGGPPVRKMKPTKLTPELQQRICQLVAGGVTLPHACAHSGVSWNTAKDWTAPGFVEREPYASYAAAIEQAKASYVVACTLRISRAGQKGAWQADLAMMERRYPEFFRPGGAGRRVEVELPGRGGGVDDEDGAPISDEALEIIIRERRMARAGGA